MMIDETQKMRAFLGSVVEQALNWQNVEAVTVRLELSNRFENNGWDGKIRIHLLGGRSYSQIFSSFDLEYMHFPSHLIDGLKQKLAEISSP